MAYPEVVDMLAGRADPASDTYIMAVPTSGQAGDLLLIWLLFTGDHAGQSAPSGWTEGVAQSVSSFLRARVYWKIADGTETTATYGRTASDYASWVVYRISGWDGVAPEFDDQGFQFDSSPDADALTPSWGSDDVLWLTLAGWRWSDNALTGWPSGYTEDRLDHGSPATPAGGTGQRIAVATRETTAASEDPGAFSITSIAYNIAVTVGVRGGTSGLRAEAVATPDDDAIYEQPEDRQPVTLTPSELVDAWGDVRFHEEDDEAQVVTVAASVGPAIASILATGLVNSDFAQGPRHPDRAIGNDNPLPGWTFRAVRGDIRAYWVEDAAAPSGYGIEWRSHDASASDFSFLQQIVPLSVQRGMFRPQFTVGAASGVAADLASVIHLRGLDRDNAAIGTAVKDETATWTTSAATVKRSLTVTAAMRRIRMRVGVKATDDVSGNYTRPLHEVLVAGDEFSPASFVLPSSASPAQTAEGSAVWDSDDDVLTVGDGVSRKTFGKLGATVGSAVGTAAAGSSVEASRADHVHPTGAATPSTQAFGDPAVVGAGPAAAMTDHKHAFPADPVPAHEAAADPHTGYVLSSAHGGVSPAGHHTRSHDHSNASDDTTLAPTQVAIVNDTAAAVPLSVKGHASQSVDLVVVEKSDGTDLLVVAPDGHLAVGAKSLDEGIAVAGNARPRLILDSGNTVKTRVFQREAGWYRGGLAVNLAWPGQYDLDDTGRTGWQVALDADGDYLAISRASAGANPRTLVTLWLIDGNGALRVGTDAAQDLGTSYAYLRSIFAGMLHLGDAITPAQLTANQNDYNPTGGANAFAWRLSSDAARDITGIAGGVDGALHAIYNVGAQGITLKDESASSSAANRFALDVDRSLYADSCVIVWYDGTSSRWRVLANN